MLIRIQRTPKFFACDRGLTVARGHLLQIGLVHPCASPSWTNRILFLAGSGGCSKFGGQREWSPKRQLGPRPAGAKPAFPQVP